MGLTDSSLLKTALQVSPFCFPSGSPGPSIPECSTELREQLEDLQETEISFVSTSLFRRKRAALGVMENCRGYVVPSCAGNGGTGWCESTRAGADLLNPPLVRESSTRFVPGTAPALSDICCPNCLKLGKREAKQRHSSFRRAQSGSDGRDKAGTARLILLCLQQRVNTHRSSCFNVRSWLGQA